MTNYDELHLFVCDLSYDAKYLCIWNFGFIDFICNTENMGVIEKIRLAHIQRIDFSLKQKLVLISILKLETKQKSENPVHLLVIDEHG